MRLNQNVLPGAMPLKRLLAFGAFASFGIGLGLYLKTKKDIQQHHRVAERLKQKPTTLSFEDRFIFPWENSVDEWEGKKIEYEGYFRQGRFMVARERDGKPGYLIFAPFATASTYSQMNASKKSEAAIVVCLGWIPKGEKYKIPLKEDILPQIDYSETPHIGDPYDGVERDQDSEGYIPTSKLVGVLRRGEQSDFLNKRVNFPKQGWFTWIDLFLMSRYFRIYNIDTARVAYLERIADPQVDDGSGTLPLASTEEELIERHSKTEPCIKKAVKPAVITGVVSLLASIIL